MRFAVMLTEDRCLDLMALARDAGREDIVADLRLARELWLKDNEFWALVDPY